MKKSLSVLGVAVGLILVGCSQPSTEEQVAAAQAFIGKGDNASAIVELKSALQQSPNDGYARFLLGSIYAQRGAASAATKELDMALRLGYDASKVVTELAPMLYLQSDSQRLSALLEVPGELSPEAKATLLAYDGLILLELDQKEKAQQRLEDAKKLPLHQATELLEAYLTFAAGNVEKAMQKAERLKQDAPSLAQATFLLAQLNTVAGDQKKTVEYFEEYRRQHPEDFRGAVFLANAYVKNQQFDKAKPLVDRLLAVSAEQPFVNFLKAVIAFNNKEFSEAKLAADKAIMNGYQDSTVRVIAGLSAFQLDNREQAYQQLLQAKQSLPPNSPVLQLLSVLALELGYTDTVLTTMEGQSELTENDVLMLSAASAELVKTGELTRARNLARRADALSLSTEAALVARGVLKLSLDELNGLADLESALAIAPGSSLANTALARAYLEEELYDKALSLAEQWQSDKPTAPNGWVYEALIWQKQNNTAAAANAFNEALTRAPSEPAANLFFADQAFASNDYVLAKSFVAKVLDEYPTYVVALSKWFALHKMLDNVNEGLRVLDAARQQALPDNKNSLDLLYAKALFDVERTQDALAILDAMPKEEQSDEYWVLLGNSYFKTGQQNKSVEAAREWVKNAPTSSLAHARLITALDLAGDTEAALTESRNASSKFALESFDLMLIDLAVRSNDVRLAKVTLQRLSDAAKSSPLGLQLQGQVLMAEKNVNEAVNVLKKAYQQDNSDRGAWLYAKALVDSGQAAIAYTHYREHLSNAAATIDQINQLAELAIRSGEKSAAIALYEQSLEAQPDNMKILNNLAFLYVEAETPVKAMPLSQRAMDLAPNNPSIMDTHAMVLWKNGQLSEAADVFEKMLAASVMTAKTAEKYKRLLEEMGDHERAKNIGLLVK